MHFKPSFRASETEDGALRFALTRMEAGAGKGELEIQFSVRCGNDIERVALSGKWFGTRDEFVAIRIMQQRELDFLLQFKSLLHVDGSDLSFMRDIAMGIIGMFVVNPALTDDTTYLLTITDSLASVQNWEGLTKAPAPLNSDLVLGSVTVCESTLEDIEDDG